MFFMSIYLNKEQMYLLIFFWISMIAVNFKYHGCPVTKLECYLIEDRWTVIDPLLQLLCIEVNNQRRYQITVITACANLLFVTGRYFTSYDSLKTFSIK